MVVEIVYLDALKTVLTLFVIVTLLFEWIFYSARDKLSDVLSHSIASFYFVKEFLYRLDDDDFLTEYLDQFFGKHKAILATISSLLLAAIIYFYRWYTLDSKRFFLSLLLLFIVNFIGLIILLWHILKKHLFTVKRHFYFLSICASTIFLTLRIFPGYFILTIFLDQYLPHFLSKGIPFIVLVKGGAYSPYIFDFFTVSLSLAVGFMIIITLGTYLKERSDQYISKLKSVQSTLKNLMKQHPSAFTVRTKFEAHYYFFKKVLKKEPAAVESVFSKREHLNKLYKVPLIFAILAVVFLVFLTFGVESKSENVLFNLNVEYVVYLLAGYILYSFSNFRRLREIWMKEEE